MTPGGSVSVTCDHGSWPGLYLHSVPKVLCLVIGLIHKHSLETWRSCARAVAGPGPASPPELVQWGNLGEVVRWWGGQGSVGSCVVYNWPRTQAKAGTLLDQHQHHHHSVQWLPRCAADTGGQEPVWDITSDRCQGGVTSLLEWRLDVIAHHSDFIDVVLLVV